MHLCLTGQTPCPIISHINWYLIVSIFKFFFYFFLCCNTTQYNTIQYNMLTPLSHHIEEQIQIKLLHLEYCSKKTIRSQKLWPLYEHNDLLWRIFGWWWFVFPFKKCMCYVLLLLDVSAMKIPFLLIFYVSTPNYCADWANLA